MALNALKYLIKVDILFILYLPLLQLKQKIIITLMMVVIIKN
jgi:hypothetical protein